MITRLKRAPKYKAKPVKQGSDYFASKLEFRLYNYLLLQQNAGEILFFLRQVPFHLPGGVKYVADYLVFYPDNKYRILEAKGFETALFKAKKKMVENLYPVKIEIIKRI
jgi:hypothetical protein